MFDPGRLLLSRLLSRVLALGLVALLAACGGTDNPFTRPVENLNLDCDLPNHLLVDGNAGGPDAIPALNRPVMVTTDRTDELDYLRDGQTRIQNDVNQMNFITNFVVAAATGSFPRLSRLLTKKKSKRV